MSPLLPPGVGGRGWGVRCGAALRLLGSWVGAELAAEAERPVRSLPAAASAPEPLRARSLSLPGGVVTTGRVIRDSRDSVVSCVGGGVVRGLPSPSFLCRGTRFLLSFPNV